MELPLFPLHTVLCPGIALPLQVFEPRYRELTERCLRDERPFGVVLIRDGREVGQGPLTLSAVGTFARIRDATRLADGRYDILVVGEGRFRIEEVTVGRAPYLLATVQGFADEVGDPALARELAGQASRRFIRYLELLQPVDGEEGEEVEFRIEVDEGEEEATSDAGPGAADGIAGDAARAERAAELDAAARRLTIPDDPTILSYLLSGIVQVELVRRQALLEAESTDVRLYELAKLLDREISLLGARLRNFAPDVRELPLRRN